MLCELRLLHVHAHTHMLMLLLMPTHTLPPPHMHRYLVIFQNYAHDLETVQKLYEKHKYDPPVPRNAPPVTGNIMWARQLLRRIESPMLKFAQVRPLRFASCSCSPSEQEHPLSPVSTGAGSTASRCVCGQPVQTSTSSLAWAFTSCFHLSLLFSTHRTRT